MPKLVEICKRVNTRWQLFCYVSRCLACEKRGFVHSWSKLNSLEQIRRTIWGKIPADGHCLLCGATAEPVLVDMGDDAFYPGQKGWLMDWWRLSSSPPGGTVNQ